MLHNFSDFLPENYVLYFRFKIYLNDSLLMTQPTALSVFCRKPVLLKFIFIFCTYGSFSQQVTGFNNAKGCHQ